jgi:hypothetical protein
MFNATQPVILTDPFKLPDAHRRKAAPILKGRIPTSPLPKTRQTKSINGLTTIPVANL